MESLPLEAEDGVTSSLDKPPYFNEQILVREAEELHALTKEEAPHEMDDDNDSFSEELKQLNSLQCSIRNELQIVESFVEAADESKDFGWLNLQDSSTVVTDLTMSNCSNFSSKGTADTVSLSAMITDSSHCTQNPYWLNLITHSIIMEYQQVGFHLLVSLLGASQRERTCGHCLRPSRIMWEPFLRVLEHRDALSVVTESSACWIAVPLLGSCIIVKRRQPMVLLLTGWVGRTIQEGSTLELGEIEEIQ